MKRFLLAARMDRMQRSTIREILKITKRPDIISFAGGLPAPELFPVKEFSEALRETLEQDGPASLQYDVTEGYPPLKEFLAEWLTRGGLPCKPDDILLTNGSQQALDLIGKVFLNPGDGVVVENPTYLGAIQAFNAYQPTYWTVPMDEGGILPRPFEKTLRKPKIKFAYLVPTFQNPSGITLSLERRKAILACAKKKNIPIVEDDPYGYLRFRGKPQPSLFALGKGRGVIYLSTFSKILSPGIRLGFVVADPQVLRSLVLAKQAADLQPNSLVQRAVYRYAKTGGLNTHIPTIVASYRQRAQAMQSAIKRHFPPSIRCIDAEGGMFLWCTLPQGASAAKLFSKAIEQKVAYVMGGVFHAKGGGDQTLRLNFTNSTLDQIEEGIRRLGKVFTSAMPAYNPPG